MAFRYKGCVAQLTIGAVAWVAAAGAAGLAGPPVAPNSPPVAAGESEAPPRLVATQRLVDLGPLVKGQQAEGKFELRNTGTGVLRIFSVKPG